MPSPTALWTALTSRLAAGNEWLPPLLLRLVMAYEYYESGIEKLRGDNWFMTLQDKFPFPFNAIPAELSWSLATWTELAGAALLLLGLFTRLAAFSLLVLTFVATAAVHWPDMWSMASDILKGYSISDRGYGNFKLPLLFSVMLLPLIFGGAGRFGLDALLARTLNLHAPEPRRDGPALAIALAVVGIPFLFLLPALGIALLLASALSILVGGLGSLAVEKKRRP